MCVFLLDYVVGFKIGFLFFPVTGIKSAFSVGRAAVGPISGTIRFTHVFTNIGRQYNTTTGVFTCQFSGLYAFTLTIFKDRGESLAYCKIRKNGSNIVSAFTDPDSNSDNGLYSGTNSAVLHLVHGDKVDVGDCSYLTSIQSHDDTSSFSGFLIKAD